MAIVFNTSPYVSPRVNNSHNNTEAVFTSNSGTPVSVQIDLRLSVTIIQSYQTQALNGQFFFNFKRAFISLFDDEMFYDTISPILDSGDPESVTIDYNDIYREVIVDYTVTLDSGATDSTTQTYTVVQSTNNLIDFSRGIDIFDLPFSNSMTLLHPPHQDDRSTFSMVWFEDYPFDFTLYSGSTDIKTITHTTPSATTDIELEIFTGVHRIFISNGNPADDITNHIPVNQGANVYTLYIDGDPNQQITTINIERISSSCGIYLKWKIPQGGWAYWLFDEPSLHEITSKSSGEIDRDYARYDNSAFFSELGKESYDTIICSTDRVNSTYRRLVTSIFDSPKIYYYTGNPGEQASSSSWIPVRLKTKTAATHPNTSEFEKITIEIELPKKDTLTL